MTAEDQQGPDEAGGYGILYGIGVGPGAPDLLTLRAVARLRTIHLVLAAASPKNEGSLALSIAAPHLPAQCEILRLDFPMTREPSVLEAAWGGNAEKVLTVLRSGKDAAFLTLGDPLIYSTFGYLMRTLLAKVPQLRIGIVPGVTSYQEAAARTGTVLCEGKENLLILSGIREEEQCMRDLALADSVVILKAYKNAREIGAALQKAGRGAGAVFASRVGLTGETLVTGCDNLPTTPHYLSLFLVPPLRGRNKG